MNNVIEQLEEWLKDKIYCEFGDECVIAYQDTLNKLRELKESDKD